MDFLARPRLTLLHYCLVIKERCMDLRTWVFCGETIDMLEALDDALQDVSFEICS